jgi:hypothetical protein
MSQDPGVEIRPEVAMYAACARLNYEPWYALAEFVDNSLQSFLANRGALQAIHGPAFRLHVGISISDDRIEIRDNAAGIARAEFPRAFRPASPPPDTTGLSEFGLGMKAAACWFSRRWTVATSALGEPFESIIVYDIPQITGQHIERLPVKQESFLADDHYTHLTLEALNVRPKTSAIGKIKRHLESIYRMFLLDGSMKLVVQGESLSYTPPEFLRVGRYNDPSSTAVEWRKELSLRLEGGRRVWGWAGLLSKGSLANAGFALFRRNRLIEGSHGEAYRPDVLFGKPNSFVYQRLVGELNVEGFTVSHTKDGIQWDDLEDEILVGLHKQLDSEPLPLLRQAEHYRARAARATATAAPATHATAVDTPAGVPKRAEVPEPVIGQRILSLFDPDSESALTSKAASPPPAQAPVPFKTEILIAHQGKSWRVLVDAIADESVYEWLDVTEVQGAAPEEPSLQITVNLAHPFLDRFISPGGPEIQAFVRLGAGLAVSEAALRATGVRQPGILRRTLNQVLRDSLSGPVEPQTDGERQDE